VSGRRTKPPQTRLPQQKQWRAAAWRPHQRDSPKRPRSTPPAALRAAPAPCRGPLVDISSAPLARGRWTAHGARSYPLASTRCAASLFAADRRSRPHFPPSHTTWYQRQLTGLGTVLRDRGPAKSAPFVGSAKFCRHTHGRAYGLALGCCGPLTLLLQLLRVTSTRADRISHPPPPRRLRS